MKKKIRRKTDRVKYTVEIDREDLEQIRKEAIQKNISIAEIIRKAIKNR